jgi:hypothetical protein
VVSHRQQGGPVLDLSDEFLQVLEKERIAARTWTEFQQRTALSQNTFNNWKENRAGKSDLLVEVCRRLERWPKELGLPEPTTQFINGILARQGWRPQPGAYSDLQSCLCRFESFVANRALDFVGREFVWKAIQRFYDRVPSGYFLIEGEPGIGKSAIIARLIENFGYVHHFNIAGQGTITARAFLKNVCARLIIDYQLPYFDLTDDMLQDGTFLSKVLQEAAAKLNGDKLVIAIDALDEVDRTGQAPGANVLFLPVSLPQGVYVVATVRPLKVLPLVVEPLDRLTLMGRSQNNLDDARGYLQAWLTRQGVQDWMRERDLDAAEFTELVLAKSEGNFMYLHHVLPAIEAGRFRKFGPEDLPAGLKDYYALHWREMRDQDQDFTKLQEPVVCVLAAAKEAVPVERIARWTQLDLSQVIAVLDGWREFLYVEEKNTGSVFQLYHGSFREFLQEIIDPGLRKYHRMIAKSELADFWSSEQGASAPLSD